MSKECVRLSIEEVMNIASEHMEEDAVHAQVVLDFAADIEKEVASRCRAQGGNTSHKTTQAATNKAAEEGGLPALPKQPEELKAHWLCEDCGGRGHDGEIQWQGHFQPPEPTMCGTCQGAGRVECEALLPEQAIEYARQAIAADRASRQVANKAEVDLSSLFRSDWSELGMLPASEGTYVDFDHVEALLATPPATTGANTCQTCGGSKVDPGGLPICRDCGPVGASTVLTDERIAALYAPIQREVAAQAGQVAVPGWISVDEQLPSSDLLPNGDCPSVIGLWKEGALAANLVQQMITNTAYLRNNPQNFTHWMPLPPSPAKESK